MKIKAIGKINAAKGLFAIELDKEYLSALKNIAGFSHLQVVWWGNMYDSEKFRSILTTDKPYKKGPDVIGIFATRSPVRPNPICITNIAVQKIDYENGIIYTPYIDAENETPILDIKPYHSTERIKEIQVPEWCDHWPKWYEDSATFNWAEEFNF